MQTLSVLLVMMVPAAARAPVVSNVYENLDPHRALTNVPITLSRIGADGDFTVGITPVVEGRKLPAQVDVLRRAPDGSIRHALVSFVIPHLAAGGKMRVDWLNEKPPTPPPFTWGFDRANFHLELLLRPEKGGALTSKVAPLIGDWSSSRRVRVLHDGPVMKEFEVHDVPVDENGGADPELDVYWRLRVFSGQKSVRVAVIVERTKERRRGVKRPIQYKFKEVVLRFNGKVLYREGPLDHIDQMRYRIVVWTAGPLENLHRRPNYAYWVKGRFVPYYRWVKPMSAKEVDAMYSRRGPMRRKPRRRQGILENGIILRHMPNTGGRWDLGLYPWWVAAYLLSGAPETYRAILHADGNGGGAFSIHVRQNGAPGYNVFTVEQPPLDRGFRLPLYRLPDGSRTPTQPDHAHAPSIGYISYLLTGDKFYAEELSFWASYHAGEWPHKGLRWQQMDRSFAWSLRQVTDAAFILPDNHPLLDYFRHCLEKCFREMTQRLVRSRRRVHSPIAGVFQCSGRQNWVCSERCSTWMYAWVVWALQNAADKGFSQALPIRDWAAEYIVGLYTSEDEFTAPDGRTYRYDPRDAMPYSTAISLLEVKIVTLKNGKKGVVPLRRIKYLDNYGEVWYYTKMNVDNGWYPERGLETLPDAKGLWPLRKDGFGHGFMYWAYDHKRRPHFNYHTCAMPALAAAIEAGLPKAEEAWKLMMKFGGKRGEYGILVLPRRKGPPGAKTR